MIVLPLKLKLATSSLATLFVAQEVPGTLSSPVPGWLDLGVTIAAIVLLGYILKLVFSGGLVAKDLIEQVADLSVKQAVNDLTPTVERAVSNEIRASIGDLTNVVKRAVEEGLKDT